MARKKIKFNKFQIPESFWDQLFELTGCENKNKGYLVCYIDENGVPQIKQKYDCQATEFALTKLIEIYTSENASAQTILEYEEPPEDDD